MRDQFLELVQRFALKPIRSEKQLEEAYRMIDELTTIPEEHLSADQSDYLEVLGNLTAAYEESLVPSQTAEMTGLDVLRHLMDEHEMNASEPGRLLGHRELGSKILRGDRQISKLHAKVLGAHFGLPHETFLR
jgi:antitoxin component HigA of HigAB toxin-antitoxin module